MGSRLGTPSSHVLLGCTHTHNGPCTSRGNLGGVHDVGADPAERAALDAYILNLKGQLAGIAAAADSRRQPARAAAGRGRVAMAVNREERSDDGRILVGRNPGGISDHSVEVLRVDDLEGNPIAVLTGYAAHPVVMGMDISKISQDFPGVVRRTVERVTGAALPLPDGGCRATRPASPSCRAIGARRSAWGAWWGCEAARVFFTIEDPAHREVRQVGASLSNLALYHKEFHEGPTHRVLKAASREVTVPLQPLPPLREAESQLAEARANLRKLEEEGAPPPRPIRPSWWRTGQGSCWRRCRAVRRGKT